MRFMTFYRPGKEATTAPSQAEMAAMGKMMVSGQRQAYSFPQKDSYPARTGRACESMAENSPWTTDPSPTLPD